MSDSEIVRLLYMDDDPGRIRLVRAVLERSGYVVDMANDSEEGLLLAGKGDYAGIILDQSLPTRSGLEVLQILTLPEEHPPIIMVTDTRDEEVAAEAIKFGASAYLHIEPEQTSVSVLPDIIRQARVHHRILRDNRSIEATLKSERKQLLSIFESLEEGIYISDVDTYEILFVNAAMKRLFGGEQMVGRRCYQVFHKRDSPCSYCTNPIILNNGGRNHRWEHKNPVNHHEFSLTDRIIRWPDGRDVRFTYAVDVTERKRTQERLEHLAYHDQLTNLPNRQLFRDRLENAMAMADRRGHSLGLLFIDVDNLKAVNDSLGHKAGDLILRGVADRLRSCVRKSDTIARQGGDEFVILLTEINHPGDVQAIAGKVVSSMKQPFQIEDKTVAGLCSVGTAVYPEDGHSADVLLRNADVALYQAKALGGGTHQKFVRELATELRDRKTLRSRILEALYRKELEVFFQPQLDLLRGEVFGVEALVRWRHPERGLLLPRDFLPLAKSVDLSQTVDLWILETSCRQAVEWRSLAPKGFRVAVNLTMRLLRDPELCTQVERILLQTGLESHSLELEIPEAVIMEDVEANIAQLGALRALGVRLSLDDFGSGHTSLCHLHRIPLHSVKMDQLFVRMLESGTKNASIASAVITLAHSLDLIVVAEGVETFGQLTHLVDSGCDALQGYVFHAPMPAEAMSHLLAKKATFDWRAGCIRELAPQLSPRGLDP